MSTLEERSTTAVSGDLPREHRAAWAAAACGDDAIDLSFESDPVAALRDARAAIWLEGYEPAARGALADAADRGAKLVVVLPAAGGEAAGLATAIGGTIVPQALLGGSLIGEVAELRVEVDDAPPIWQLVCANVDVAATARATGAAGTALSAHVARLEQALEALQEANVRLAREQLGRHDAAAGTVVGRLEQRALAAEAEAREWQRRFEFEQQLAMTHHEWYMALHNRLQSRRYLLVDRVHGFVMRIPGVKLLLRLRG